MDEYHYRTIVDMTPCRGRPSSRADETVAKRPARMSSRCRVLSGAHGHSVLVPASDRGRACGLLRARPDRRDGIRRTQTGIKAGAIKIATGQESVDPKPSPIGPNGRRIHIYEDRLIRAAGRAQKATGCCINTHTDPMDYTVTNPGIEQLDIIEEEGGDPTKVIIGHAFVEPQGIQQIDGNSASAARTCRSTTSAYRGAMTTRRSSTNRWRT